MRRGAALASVVLLALALVLLLAACGSVQPPGEPVPLLTYQQTTDSCLTDAETWFLLADDQIGTRMVRSPTSRDPERPVVWPSGYVGRRVGSEVSVYAASGQLVATTGKYWFLPPSPERAEGPIEFFVGSCDVPLHEWTPPPSSS